MGTRLKCFLVLIMVTLLDLGPFPLASLIGIYVVLRRPAWFKDLVDTIYEA
jgi:hypothetical protein